MSYALGDYLKNLRGNKSLREVAERTGGRISHSYISDVEKGVTHRGTELQPSPETLRTLADVYHADYTHLLELAGYLKPENHPAEAFTLALRKRLKELRKEQHRSQQQIADYLGIPVEEYEYFENEKIFPVQEILVKLADFFHVSTDYLLGRTVEMTESSTDKAERTVSEMNITEQLQEMINDHSTSLSSTKKEEDRQALINSLNAAIHLSKSLIERDKSEQE